MPTLKEGQSQINIVTTEETHRMAKEQSKKIFGKENVAAYIELIIRLDAATELISSSKEAIKIKKEGGREKCEHYKQLTEINQEACDRPEFEPWCIGCKYFPY